MKRHLKGGALVAPVPAVMVSCGDMEKSNIITIAWCGITNTVPPTTYISVRPERYSYSMIEETGEFVINLTTKELVRACDYCGVKSGRDVDKFKEMNLTQLKMDKVKAPGIAESPVNIQCKVVKKEELGSHHMFIARVVSVQVDEAYIDETGKFCLNDTGLMAYSHGEYRKLGEGIGRFGYSVKKKK